MFRTVHAILDLYYSARMTFSGYTMPISEIRDMQRSEKVPGAVEVPRWPWAAARHSIQLPRLTTSYRSVTVRFSSLAQLQQKVCADQVREICRQHPATLPLLLLVLTALKFYRFTWERSSRTYRDVTGPEACC